MRKFALILPAAIVLATATSALAADYTTDSGRITSMNPQTGAIGLDNGHHYVIPNPGMLKGIMPGEHVVVTVSPNHSIGFEEDPTQFDGSGENL